MDLQYVVYDYWLYGYCEGDAIIEDGAASVTGTATVTASPTRIEFFSGAVTATTTVTADGYRIRLNSGSITGIATVTSDAIRIRTSSGSITGTATVTALGGVVYSGVANVDGICYVDASAKAVYSGNGSIVCSATVVSSGNIIGENWNNVPVDTKNTNVWYRKDNLLYVELDYWLPDYVEDKANYWYETESSSNTWYRQG